MKRLTWGQARAMEVLVQAHALGVLAERSKESNHEHSHWMRVNSQAVTALLKLGYARSRCVLIDGTEVKGADLVHLLGYWKIKYEITARGLHAWQTANVRDRWGLLQYATKKKSQT